MNTLVTTNGLGLAAAADGAGALPPGAMAGPWRVEREIGRGGMGAVYAVVHDEIGKRAALKVIHERLGPAHAERTLVEARVVNRVGHPNIVDIFETGQLPDGRPYIVMERLHGVSLAQRARLDKIMPLEVIAILRQVCDALVAAHDAGVIHRDLKTDNVFLVPNADGGTHVKLLDWGIAKEISNDARRTIEGVVVGTPHYLSPEQACGAGVSDRSDVYALGVVAFELFLEQLPFEAETVAEIMTMHLRNAPPLPRDLWPDIPRKLEDLLLAMLAKEPAQRPCMREVVTRLEAVAAELERRREERSIAAGLIPPRTSAAMGSVGGDEPARAKPWLQWAFGGVALAMSLALLMVSQEPEGIAADAVDVSTAAAPAPATTPSPSPSPSPSPATLPSPSPSPSPSPLPSPSETTTTSTSSSPSSSTRTASSAPTPTARHHAAPPRPTPIPKAHLDTVATRLAPHPTMTLATQHDSDGSRRAVRALDPDGTITPYQ